eukprot:scaffold3190_cov409-Prasinococcus_capsulatus_cf.AAC.11
MRPRTQHFLSIVEIDTKATCWATDQDANLPQWGWAVCFPSTSPVSLVWADSAYSTLGMSPSAVSVQLRMDTLGVMSTHARELVRRAGHGAKS